MLLSGGSNRQSGYPKGLGKILKRALIWIPTYIIAPFSVWIAGFVKNHNYSSKLKEMYREHDGYNPNVAFVIPCRNKEDTIYEVLGSIIGQSYRPKKMKIMVTDDYSTDRSLGEILRFVEDRLGRELTCERVSDNEELCRTNRGKGVNGTEIDFVLIKHLRYNLGKQRSLNKMISLIDEREYELTATIDADTKLHPDWLKNAVKPHVDPNVVATFGWVHLWSEKSYGILKRAREFEYKYLNHMRRFFNPDSHWTMSGSNILYKTEILKRYPIPEHMKENAAEDLLHTIELQSRGYKIVFVPEAIAYSKEELDWEGFVKQTTRWMKGGWYTLLEYVLPNDEIWKGLKRLHKLQIAAFLTLPYYLALINGSLIAGLITQDFKLLIWPTIDYLVFLGIAGYGYVKYRKYMERPSIREVIGNYTVYYFLRNLTLIPYIKGFVEYRKLAGKS